MGAQSDLQLSEEREDAQAECQIDFYDRKNGEVRFSAKGFADVVKDDTVYGLKFVSRHLPEYAGFEWYDIIRLLGHGLDQYDIAHIQEKKRT